MLGALRFLYLVGSSCVVSLIKDEVIHEGSARLLSPFPSQRARYFKHTFCKNMGVKRLGEDGHSS